MNTIKSVNWLSAYNCAWDSGGQCSHGGCRRGRVRRYRHAAGACAAHAMSEEEGDAPVTRADFATLFSALTAMESKVSGI